MSISRFILAVLLLCTARMAGAELIDGYSVNQGPFTVGPGEAISEDDGVLQTDTVLGGFRVLIPALDENAPAGSTVTAGVAGGGYTCRIDMSTSGSDGGGGCGSGYDRGENELWDLTGSTALELDITSVSGSGMVVQIMLIGPDDSGAMAVLESPSPGVTSLPLSQLLQFTPNALELDRVDSIIVNVTNVNLGSGHVTIDRLGTDGPIANGEAVPGDDPEDENVPDSQLRNEVYGNFYDPMRSGEGIQLTLENDGETFILTYYTYLDGEQVWLIGTGKLSEGRIEFADMSITEGADYGGAFDAADVDATFWGIISMDFINCNRAVLSVSPELSGFEPYFVEMQRIVPTDCGSGGPSPFDRVVTGNWYDPQRSGEGFQLAYEEGQFILTFYTYIDGRQVWMLGVGSRSGSSLTFPDVYITEGGDFGGRFRPQDVENIRFGSIEMALDDCNHASMEVDSDLPEFEDQILDVQKIVPGSCTL